MSLVDILGGIGRLTKLFNNLELEFKSQATEITLLRKDNAELRKDISAMAERLARVEESRNTASEKVRAEVAIAVSELRMRYNDVVTELRLSNKEEELERRFAERQIPPAKANSGQIDRTIAALREMNPLYGDATPGQLALAWLLAHPSGIIPLVGSNNPDHIRESASTASITVSRTDWYKLWVASRGKNVP